MPRVQAKLSCSTVDRIRGQVFFQSSYGDQVVFLLVKELRDRLLRVI